jgi:hypothetical protein
MTLPFPASRSTASKRSDEISQAAGTGALLYPSDERIKELQRVCNEDPEFRDACSGFSGKLVFQIDAEPGKLDDTAHLFCWPDRGDFGEAMALASADERPDVETIIAGKYSAWKEVVTGGQEPPRALMSRRVKLVEGSQLKLLKQVKFALRMMHNSTQIDARFPDEQP